MTEPASDGAPSPSEALAARLRLALIAALAVSALALLYSGGAHEDPPPDPVHTLAAVGLALASIVTRALAGSPRLEGPSRAYLWMASLACAAGLGILGWVAALRLDAPTTGLVYTLAAVIFCLRRPAPIHAR